MHGALPKAAARLLLLAVAASACSPASGWRSTMAFFFGPDEPPAKWFHLYPGEMRPREEVAVLCIEEPAAWVQAIRVEGGREWFEARHEKWHFPRCIEVLPGVYELAVHYFAREHDSDVERSVTRQAESTEPSRVRWRAEAGGSYRLEVRLGALSPASGAPPQRHIPRSRALGTTWWELEEAEWRAEVVRVPSWDALGPAREQREAWRRYERRR